MKTKRMKIKFSRRDFLKMSLLSLGAAFLAACEQLVKLTPTSLPALKVTPSDTVPPQPTYTSTPEPVDIPIYKNSFEEITDLVANGITSIKNELRINTENVDFQSGSQSLEALGTIDAAAFSALTIDFSIQGMTGGNSVDLSNKTVGFSYFIPTDSPIDIIILVAQVGTKQVSLAATDTAGSSNKDRGKWHYQQFDLKNVYENNAWFYTNLSNDEARGVVKHSQVLQLAGMRIAAGNSVPASFLIDDFKWIGINDLNHLPIDNNVDTLRKYADMKHLKVGAVLIKSKDIDWFSDPWYRYTLAKEFNLTTAGCMDSPDTKPADISAINFDYSDGDQELAFAEGNGMFIRGGTGGGRTGNPRWVLDANYDELKAFLERKIEQDISHFGGKVFSWGVFNEVVNDEGNGFFNRQNKNPNDPSASSWAPYGLRFSPWVDGNDTSLIEAAFIKAREVDPNARLFLNEFRDEEIGKQRSEFIYNFVTGMKKRGVPIDGIGFQLHNMFPKPPLGWAPDLEDLEAYLDRVDRNIKRYAAADLLVEFTEAECQIRLDDIDLATQAGRDEYARRAKEQAELYAGLMKLAVENPNVLSFTIWTVVDKPGRSAYDSPAFSFTYTDSFLFDKNYDPKPAYYAVLNVLKS